MTATEPAAEGVTLKCSTCDEPLTGATRGEALTLVRQHRAAAHPGVSSDNERNRRRARAKARERAEAQQQNATVTPIGAAAAGEVEVEHGPPAPPLDEVAPLDPHPELIEPVSTARPSLKDRLWRGGKGRDKSAAGTAAGPETRPPRSRGRRTSTESMFSTLWAGIGWGLVQSQADVPVGRCMQAQAPVAGELLERLTKDTVIDRIIQPFAGKMDDAGALGNLVALPVLIGMYERATPEFGQMLAPMIRAALLANLTAMLPVVKKQQADAAKAAKVVEELFPGAAEAGIDPIDAMLETFFAPPGAPAPHEEAREAATHVG